MRARLALLSAGARVELREILLKDKPPQFLDTSASATVPALRLGDRVIDESLDIMVWALNQNDPQGLLDMPKEGWDLIVENDGPFKTALDHTKYASRYPELDESTERSKAAQFVTELQKRLSERRCLFGSNPSIADVAVLPFIRQFAYTDRAWFNAQTWPDVIVWLDRFLESDAFAVAMTKYKPWSEGATPIWFSG